MDEFSTEDEQVEEIRKWWSENWKQVIGGLAIGLALIFGYRGYVEAKQAIAERASVQYDLLQDAVDNNDVAAAEGILATLASDYASTPYRDQAYMAIARLRVENGDLTGASQMLASALESKDKELAMVARMRLARIRIEQGEFDAALELVSGQSAESFAGLFADIRGDIHAAAGRDSEARAAYEEALALDNENLVNRDLIEMKLAALATPAVSADEDG